MTAGNEAAGTVRFGLFEADLRTGELRRRGTKVPLQEQPFQVLAALIARPGELVSREELRNRLWRDAEFGDFDAGLNKAVNKIRQALGDSADNPRFVETLARRGYRFIAPVEGAPPAQGSGALRVLWESRTIPLREGDNIIGRDEGAAVRVDSSTVSRQHARIRVSGASATLEDLGSKNGTFVAERRVESPTLLEDGDEIRVGSARMTFRVSSPSGSTATAQ